MSNFLLSVNTTAPVFLLLLLGFILKQLRVLNTEFVNAASHYAFCVGLPVMLFQNIYQANILELFDAGFLLFCTSAMCTAALFLLLVAKLFIRTPCKRGSFAQGAFRGNAAIIGLSLANNIYGVETGLIPLMLAAILPIYNIMSVLILSLCAEERAGNTHRMRNVATDIAKNPIIWGVFSGIACSLMQISFPPMFVSVISNLANTATPIALLGAGAAFGLYEIKQDWKLASMATVIKLIILPVACILPAIALGYCGSTLFAVLIMSAVPSASTSYIMAKNMKSDDRLAASILTITTLFSPLTLTGWIFVLNTANLL